MFKGTRAYLYKESTVVLNKEDIANSKDEEYKEVMIYLPIEFLKQSVKELEEGE